MEVTFHLVLKEEQNLEKGTGISGSGKTWAKSQRCDKTGLNWREDESWCGGTQHLCVNHREDDLGETDGNRMQRLEGCALNIGLWPVSVSRYEVLVWRMTCIGERLNKLRDIEVKNSSILHTSTKPLLILYPPFLLPIYFLSVFLFRDCLYKLYSPPPTAVFLVLVSYFIFISSCSLSTCLQYKVMLMHRSLLVLLFLWGEVPRAGCFLRLLRWYL